MAWLHDVTCVFVFCGLDSSPRATLIKVLERRLDVGEELLHRFELVEVQLAVIPHTVQIDELHRRL